MKRSAFSLVEVTLALGLVSICLLAVMGLLPVGLKSVKNANEQSGAAAILDSLAARLRTAVTTNGVDFSTEFAGNDITFQRGGPAPAEFVWTDLTLEGTSDAHSKRISARLNIVEPPQGRQPGRAVISVAWSAAANPQWAATEQAWTGADGFITSGVQFMPPP